MPFIFHYHSACPIFHFIHRSPDHLCGDVPGVAAPGFNSKHPLFEDAIQPVHDHIGQVWLGPFLLAYGLTKGLLAQDPLHLRHELSLHQVHLAPLVDILIPCMEVRSKFVTTAMENIEKSFEGLTMYHSG